MIKNSPIQGSTKKRLRNPFQADWKSIPESHDATSALGLPTQPLALAAGMKPIVGARGGPVPFYFKAACPHGVKSASPSMSSGLVVGFRRSLMTCV